MFQAILIVVIFLGIIIGGTAIVLKQYEEKEIVVKNDSYLKLDFSKGITEKNNDNLFELESKAHLYSVLEAIRSATTDPNIKGIYLDIDEVAISTNHIEEIGESIDTFKKSGKKVYAFTRNINNSNYRLGIYADKIIMPPINSSSIDLTGYYREFNYFKGLADYVGIKFNVIHIGDYKAYGEQYSKGAMSKEFKEDIERVYNHVYNNRIGEISKRRNLDVFSLDTSILNGNLMMITPDEGEKLGLIDELLYKEEFEKKYKIKETISLGDYLTTFKPIERADKIAIIYASGEIHYNKTSKSSDTIDIETLKKELKSAKENEDIKGIVLRVNSPGGSALASEIIHHELSLITKPIYVSMGGVAASGGYYISAGTNKIFATKSTLTGSIGVVSIIPNASELIKKSKVNIEKVQKGKFSGMYSLTSPMTDEEFNKIRTSSNNVYMEFKDRVSTGRDINLEKLETIAGGRVWLGEEAKKNRLVDEIGTLEDTIKALGLHLKLKNYQVVEILEKKSIYDTILGYKGFYLKIKSFIQSPLEESVKFKIKEPLLLMPYEFN
jgi:protease-4